MPVILVDDDEATQSFLTKSLAMVGRLMKGCSSPSYFSECFQQQFKLSPKEYAERNIKYTKEGLSDFLMRN